MARTFLIVLVISLWATGARADRYADCQQVTDLDLKIRACTKIIDRGKQEPRVLRASAYLARGVAYSRRGDADRANADFTKAIALEPNSATAYIYRGRAYETKGNREQAIVEYRKALEIDPSNRSAQLNFFSLVEAP